MVRWRERGSHEAENDICISWKETQGKYDDLIKKTHYTIQTAKATGMGELLARKN